ncbi:hypothetical protein [Roseibium sp.]|uniref:hypothetical protein n=1 Tax=Roseibium sp. TaxID=1936156 RepID=UPI003A987729
MTFSRGVFISGIWNIGLGIAVALPMFHDLLQMQIPNPLFAWIVAGLLWYTAATLIVSARDVRTFAPVIVWEAVLRFFAAGVLAVYGVQYLGLLPSVLMGFTDFAWGLFYLAGIRRHTSTPFRHLLAGHS